MVHGTRLSLALIGSTSFLLAAKCCDYDCAPPEPVLRPAIDKVEILPWRVVTQNKAKFTMRARLKDRWGNVLLDWRADAVQWSTLGSVTVPPGPSGSVVVDATVPTAILPHWFQLIATIDGVADTVTIEILPDQLESGTSIDRMATDQSNPTDPPTIALVDGVLAGPKTINDTVIAFAQHATLDAFDCPDGSYCGEVTIFHQGSAIARDTVKWSSGCDFVSLSSTLSAPSGCPAPPTVLGVLQAIKPAQPVHVVVWKASSAPDVDQKVDGDVAFAQSVFNRPGTGLLLDFVVNPTGTSVQTVTFTVPCNNHDLAGQLPKPPITFGGDRITVVYVDELSSAVAPTSENGFTCLYSPVEGPIVMISTGGLGTSTLAHELGHAIGGWVNPSPEPFHVDVPVRLPGFEPSDVMWSADPDTTRGLRVNLTLGQLFQMSYRDGSYLQKSRAFPYKSVVCYPVTPTSPCPAVEKDVTR
jgi:hypothetical protein